MFFYLFKQVEKKLNIIFLYSYDYNNNKILVLFHIVLHIFLGINCEQKYSECSNQPCLNNGTCLDYDGITCQCPDGYSGKINV